MVAQLICRTQGGGVINTAFIERLNATFRQRSSCLTRRTRHLAQQAETLAIGMFVVGFFYNFCDSLVSANSNKTEMTIDRDP